MHRLWHWAKRWLAKLNPHKDTWRGMGRALHYGGWLILAATVLTMVSGTSLGGWLGISAMVGALIAAVFGIWLTLGLISKARPGFRFGLLLALVATLITALGFGALGVVLYAGWVLMVLLLLGGGVASWRRLGGRWHNATALALGTVGLVVLSVAFLVEGWQVEEDIHWQPMASLELAVPNPGEPGAYTSQRYFYGPGNDPHRAEFGEGVDLVTASVDGSKLLDGWEGAAGWARSRFWGVEAESLPVRGRAHVPDGNGPYPIVLIVHGNHRMEDYSDDGYEYLTEHFASRGFIAASVDENFLNSSLGDLLGGPNGGLEEESDARGWMLLQHLRQWRDWNQDPEHPFFGKVDLDRVVLIGHSRGGEAVSEAAVFNRLSAYPDDATLKFDFDFGLRGVIAIAPVDHQYHPRDRDTPTKDVNYLVIHGSHDGDVTAYAGFATYSRLSFDACEDCFKAGFYLVGANHGQFNTGWGRYDNSAPRLNFLNLDPIMNGDDQRAVAKVVFTAFLEATLNDDVRYRRLLAAPEQAHRFFPEDTRYLSHFRDATDMVLADFEEDADVATGSNPGVGITADGLALWKEFEVPLKWRDTDTAAAMLGWHAENGEPSGARYRFDLPALETSGHTTLAMSLAMSGVAPGEVEDYEPPESIDFTLQLEDRHGARAAIRLSSRRALLPKMEPRLYKLKAFGGNARSEVVFQRYRFVLEEWQAVEPALDVAALTSLTLLFDQTSSGTILVDDVVLSNEGY